jgi:hypothetical protein
MDQQGKLSSLEKLQNAIKVMEIQQEEIMATGTIVPQLWDELLHPDLLGNLCPTSVLIRAFITQIKLMNDDILKETIMEYFEHGSSPKRTKTMATKEWFDFMKKQLALMKTNMDTTTRGEEKSMASAVSLVEKVKIDIKLPTYDGTPDNCDEWFFALEKSLTRMKVDKTDYLLYATSHTTGTAKDAITMLEHKHKDEYDAIKKELIEMFDSMKQQEFYENFLQRFKQLHTETVTSLYIRYQNQIQRLMTRGIWQDGETYKFNALIFFRSKLKPEISRQLAILLEQHNIQEPDLDLEKVYRHALIAEKSAKVQIHYGRKYRDNRSQGDS